MGAGAACASSKKLPKNADSDGFGAMGSFLQMPYQISTP